MSNKWSAIIKLLQDAGIGFKKTNRANKIHIAKDDMSNAIEQSIREHGGHLAPVYNDKWVKRPAYIQGEVDAVPLTKPDVTEFTPRGRNDMRSVAYKKRMREPDSVAVSFTRKAVDNDMDDALREAKARHVRKATDKQLYDIEGDIQGGGASVIPARLSERLLNEPEFRQDALDRIYHTLKTSGANEDADRLIRNVKTRYDIDYVPGESPLEFAPNAGIDDIIGFRTPHQIEHGPYSSGSQFFVSKYHYPGLAKQEARIGYGPGRKMGSGWDPDEQRLSWELQDIADRRAQQQLPSPVATELTEPADILQHKWLAIHGTGSSPIGFVTPDGKYFVAKETALPHHYEHYSLPKGPIDLAAYGKLKTK